MVMVALSSACAASATSSSQVVAASNRLAAVDQPEPRTLVDYDVDPRSLHSHQLQDTHATVGLHPRGDLRWQFLLFHPCRFDFLCRTPSPCPLAALLPCHGAVRKRLGVRVSVDIASSPPTINVCHASVPASTSPGFGARGHGGQPLRLARRGLHGGESFLRTGLRHALGCAQLFFDAWP